MINENSKEDMENTIKQIKTAIIKTKNHSERNCTAREGIRGKDDLTGDTDPFSSWLSIARTMVRMAMAASGHRDTRPEMVVAHWLAGTPNTKVQMVSKSSWERETVVSVLSEKPLSVTKYVYPFMFKKQSILQSSHTARPEVGISIFFSIPQF